MAITYLEVPRQETVTIKVKLDGIQVGRIKHTHRGWEYFPKGKRTGGAVFATLAACKESLVGTEPRYLGETANETLAAQDVSKPDYSQTYWSHRGTHETPNAQLRTLIPESGEVENPDANPALETYRIAVNCYYDLYNNGLCNRRDEFETVFEFVPGTHDDLDQDTIDRTETRMDEIILAAYAEQFPAKKLTVTVPEGWQVRDIKTGEPADVTVKHVPEYELALRYIATLWPEPESCGDLSINGINDGKARLITAHAAVNAARKAIGLPLHKFPGE